MTYEFDGTKYAQASTHQKEWGTRLIEELELQGHESVLDLGCGDGTLTAQIAELLPTGRVTGIDSSQGMIDTACRNTRKLADSLPTIQIATPVSSNSSTRPTRWL